MEVLMNIKFKIIKKVLLMLCFLMIQFYAANRYCTGYGYVFSNDFLEYQVLGTDFQLLTEGKLKVELLKLIKDKKLKQILNTASYFEVLHDAESNKAVFLIGQGQEDKYYGFLIFQMEPLRYELRYVSFISLIEKGIVMTETPIHYLIYNNKLYISYWVEHTPKTEVYDINTSSPSLVKEYSYPSYKISDPYFGIRSKTSCILDGKLYSRHLFDINSGEMVTKAGIPPKFFSVDCKNGYLLEISSISIEEPVTLLLENLNTDPIIRKKVETSEKITGFSGDEWYLSKDANFIIRDERKENAKTGRLVFIDVDTKEKKEINVPLLEQYGNKIAGFSLSGKLMFYRSGQTLYVINLEKLELEKTLNLPFAPLGIVWP
jgi:hypothetical protein